MKTLLAILTAAVTTAAAPAAAIVIKNDTGNAPKIEIFQDGRRIVCLKRFRPGEWFEVQINEAGKKPLFVITAFGRHTSVFLPVKDTPLFFQLSWLTNVAR